ncbi:MAG: class I SAM-dependent methyltransferase [Treponema sp.]|jgi:SAM-dependent methyltransferase|nr:class I SAM-dependent methyltransferase [Treponema sp.]
MDREFYTDINSRTIDGWVKDGWEWGIPVSAETFQRAKEGDWEIFLTPTKPVPRDWFPPLRGRRVLGLAAGGGQQMPLLAAQGAICVVLDYSDRQLENDRFVADREGYTIETVKADMTKRLPFDDGSFDMILHPVSNCYVEDVYHVWNEACRVLKPQGLLIAGMDNGFRYMFDDETRQPLTVVNKLPYNPLTNPVLYNRDLQENGGIQFSHTVEEQVGGQIRAGFILTGLYEDRDREGQGLLRDYMPQYLVTLAYKPRSGLWD